MIVKTSTLDTFLFWISVIIVLGLSIYSIYLAQTKSATCTEYVLDEGDYSKIATYLSDDGKYLKRNDTNTIDVDAIKIENSLQLGFYLFKNFKFDDDVFKVDFTILPNYPNGDQISGTGESQGPDGNNIYSMFWTVTSNDISKKK